MNKFKSILTFTMLMGVGPLFNVALADTECAMGSYNRCIDCLANVEVICPNGVKGYVGNISPVNEIKLTYTVKSLRKKCVLR